MLKRYFLHGVVERQGQYAFSWKMVASVDKRCREKKKDLFPLGILWANNMIMCTANSQDSSYYTAVPLLF